jgi:hypothetical protein
MRAAAPLVLLGLGLLRGPPCAAALAASRVEAQAARAGRVATTSLPDDGDDEDNAAYGDAYDLTADASTAVTSDGIGSPVVPVDLDSEGGDSGATAAVASDEKEDQASVSATPAPATAVAPGSPLPDLVQRQVARERQLQGQLTELEGETMRLQAKLTDTEKAEAEAQDRDAKLQREVDLSNQANAAMENRTIRDEGELQTCALARNRLRSALASSWHELRRLRKLTASATKREVAAAGAGAAKVVAGNSTVTNTPSTKGVEEVPQELAKLRAERDAARSLAHESIKELNTSQGTLQTSVKELASTKAVLAATMMELNKLKSEREGDTQAETKLKALDKKAGEMLHRLTQRLDVEQKELANVTATADAQQKELANARSEVDVDKKELAVAHAAVAAEQKETIDAYAQVGTVHAQLMRAEKELKDASTVLNSTQAELTKERQQSQVARVERAKFTEMDQERGHLLNTTKTLMTQLWRERQRVQELNYTRLAAETRFLAERSIEVAEGSELNKTRVLLAGVMDDLRKAQKELTDVRQQLSERTAEIGELKKQRTHSDAQTELAAKEKKLVDATAKELAAKGKELTVARAALSARNSDLKTAQDQVTHLTRQLAEARAIGGSGTGVTHMASSRGIAPAKITKNDDLESVEEYQPSLDNWGSATETLMKEDLDLTTRAAGFIQAHGHNVPSMHRALDATDLEVLHFALKQNTTLRKVCAALATESKKEETNDAPVEPVPRVRKVFSPRGRGQALFPRTPTATAPTVIRKPTKNAVVRPSHAEGNHTKAAPAMAAPANNSRPVGGSASSATPTTMDSAVPANRTQNATVRLSADDGPSDRQNIISRWYAKPKNATQGSQTPMPAAAEQSIEAAAAEEPTLSAVAADLMALRESGADLQAEEHELDAVDVTAVPNLAAMRKDLAEEMKQLQENRAGVIAAADVAVRVA